MWFEPRDHVPFALSILAPVAAVGVASIIGVGLIVWSGSSALHAYGLLILGAAGSLFAITETLTRAVPILLTGLAVAIAFRTKFWNIGAEGQLYMGALAAAILGGGAFDIPGWLMPPAVLFAGALAGSATLIGPAALRIRFGVDEVVTTLLLNFIVLLFISMLLEGALKDPLGMGWPQTAPVLEAAELPKLIERSRLHIGFIVALAAAVILWFIDRHTLWGYESRAVGYNSRAAAFLGMTPHWVRLRTALWSGGLAGLAGAVEVIGLKGYLTLDLSPGFGYVGIVVAMLARLHPLGVVMSAIFIAGIFVGADTMSRTLPVPSYIADVLVAISLLCVLVSGLVVSYRIRKG